MLCIELKWQKVRWYLCKRQAKHTLGNQLRYLATGSVAIYPATGFGNIHVGYVLESVSQVSFANNRKVGDRMNRM